MSYIELLDSQLAKIIDAQSSCPVFKANSVAIHKTPFLVNTGFPLWYFNYKLLQVDILDQIASQKFC